MKVGIIGGGVVGSAQAKVWSGFADEVKVWDIDPSRRDCENRWQVIESDLVFICLPEQRIEEFFSTTLSLRETARQRRYVIKSTVPIGMTRKIKERFRIERLIHSPEFLTERTAEQDALHPRLNVMGIEKSNEASEFDLDYYTILSRRFYGVGIFTLSYEESEMMKLMMNAFFAVKIAFFNEAKTLAQKLSLDWEAIIQSIIAEGRVHPNHTQVPGPDGKNGFGGKCLPKDVLRFSQELLSRGLIASLSSAAVFRNQHDRGRP